MKSHPTPIDSTVPEATDEVIDLREATAGPTALQGASVELVPEESDTLAERFRHAVDDAETTQEFLYRLRDEVIAPTGVDELFSVIGDS